MRNIRPRQSGLPGLLCGGVILWAVFCAPTLPTAAGDVESARKTPAQPRWARSIEGPPTAAAEEPISGPRDLLRRYGIDDSHFNKLIDGAAIDESQTETLLSVIYRVCDFQIPDENYRIRSFRMVDVERWARPELDLAELAKDPDASRGQFFRLSGRVGSIEVIRPFPEVARRFELPQYYRCELALSDRAQPAVVFTRNVPLSWREGGKPDHRASAFGLFLKLSAEDARRPVPVFVAPRIAWHPETLLGNLGMDVGLLEDVQDRRRLSQQDRECFYQMISAVARAKPRRLLREAQKLLRQSGLEESSVVPLFNEPQRQHGRLVTLLGTARRVLRIRVEDPDVVARFGIHHYYNVWLYTEDSQNNPLVFCVRSLPDGMPEGDGPEYRQQVRLTGFFMKGWAYPIGSPDETAAAESGRVGKNQVAPLLIGEEPIWYPYQPATTNTLAGAIAGGLFILALLGIWIALWRYGRGDKAFRNRTIARTLGGDSAASLDEIAQGLDVSPPPDRQDALAEKRGP